MKTTCFNLKAPNGLIIMTSQGDTSKSACQNGIESLKANCSLKKMYSSEIAQGGSFYFNLTAGNTQVIGTSQMYTSTQGRDNGIASVRKNAPKAEIVDLSVNV
ncbi:MAG: YegP family protein [Bacteroidales bacterium]|nr:YegP family protein [Bacteroidales bacterium]